MRQSAAVHSAAQHGSTHGSARPLPTVPAECDPAQHFLCQMCPDELPTHMELLSCMPMNTHLPTIPMITSWLIQPPDYLCHPKSQFLGCNSRKQLCHPDLFSHPTNQTFSLLPMGSHSCKWNNYYCKLGAPRLNTKVAWAQTKSTNWGCSPWPLSSSKCPSMNLWCQQE